MSDMSEYLDLRMEENDSGKSTVREYLKELLRAVWREGEDFSGKRPFGNSGWEYDLLEPLISAGFINATHDEDGYLEDLPYAENVKFRNIIDACIDAL